MTYSDTLVLMVITFALGSLWAVILWGDRE